MTRNILLLPRQDDLLPSFFPLLPSFRITYVQSSPGGATPLPLGSTSAVSSSQQAPSPAGPSFLQSPVATLGFTAIAPACQTLVQPIVASMIDNPVNRNTFISSCSNILILFYHRSATPPGTVSNPERSVTSCTSLDSHPSACNCHLPKWQPRRKACVRNSRATKHHKFHIHPSDILITSNQNLLKRDCATAHAGRCADGVSGKHADGG